MINNSYSNYPMTLKVSHSEMLRSSSRTFQPQTFPRLFKKKRRMWPIFCKVSTLLIPDFILKLFGMKTPSIRSAWREKFALCTIIAISCLLLAFMTYGMNWFVCKSSNQYVYSNLHNAKFKRPIIIANGYINYSDKTVKNSHKINYSNSFRKKISACKAIFDRGDINSIGEYKFDQDDIERVAPIHYLWNDVKKLGYIVIKNKVYDPSTNTESSYRKFISMYKGADATKAIEKALSRQEESCFKESFYCGEIATKTPGCIIADFMLYITTVIIFSLIISRFFLATFYSWYIRRRVRRLRTSLTTPIICLVTCYSEGLSGLRSTLNSLSEQEYENKLILVIADGMIKGSENDTTTPEIILSLMELDNELPVNAHDYIALAKGINRHNRAKVYCGYYNTELSRTKMITIIKCGNETEKFKQGNRGKRDSQVILMSFYYKLLHDDRFCNLDYDIYQKIKHMTKLEPKDFELVLMVDADTIVKKTALTQFIKVFEADPKVMGMCGETKILNKCDGWVTMIQVFEYYISHHLTKSFESVFGGVTCLPGCFCAYRIYSKNTVNSQKTITPILCNAFILNAYSVFETNTLHQKNLLLLGEDRYLTTILLKNFYKRKLVFIPTAQCETFVPSEFKVLLSQRRRWINSTIHNLFELVLVDKLCGTFCCSMQFVVIVELFGTLVLPAAIFFTGVLLISAVLIKPEWIPLIMLIGILGLPAVLIFLTTLEISYCFWLIIYIFSLPIWNFILPVYAFWHFDDFTWGETRKIEGEDVAHGEGEGEFDSSRVELKHLDRLERDFENMKKNQNIEENIIKDGDGVIKEEDDVVIKEEEINEDQIKLIDDYGC